MADHPLRYSAAQHDWKIFKRVARKHQDDRPRTILTGPPPNPLEKGMVLEEEEEAKPEKPHRDEIDPALIPGGAMAGDDGFEEPASFGLPIQPVMRGAQGGSVAPVVDPEPPALAPGDLARLADKLAAHFGL